MDSTVALFKALADRNRLRILAALIAEKEICACQLSELLDISGPSVSRHLAQIQNAGLVVSRKEGRWVFYKLNPLFPTKFPFDWLEQRLLTSKELDRDRKQIKKIMAMDREEICKRQRGEGDFTSSPRSNR